MTVPGLQNTFSYRDHMLICRPQRLKNGRYLATLVIAFEFGGDYREVPQVLRREPFATEGEAIDFARTAGQVWVDRR